MFIPNPAKFLDRPKKNPDISGVHVKAQIKICPVCGREFHNRKKRESRGIWDRIKYCSKKCQNETRKRPMN
jgi:hypothetical protein